MMFFIISYSVGAPSHNLIVPCRNIQEEEVGQKCSFSMSIATTKKRENMKELFSIS